MKNKKFKTKRTENGTETKKIIKTNLCCELARLGGGIGVIRFVSDPLETKDVFLLRGNGATLSCAKENVL